MASNAKWKIMNLEDLDIIEAAKFEKLISEFRRRSGKRDDQMIFAKFEVTQVLPNALADIIEGYTNAFDSIATTTLHILSSDADDTVGGAGCEGVHLVYIKGNVIYDTLYPLAGTAHSHINNGTWDRLIGMYVDLTTTVVPQGNIILDVHLTGTVYCTIVAGDTYSITSKMWVPSGWKMAVVDLVPLITIVGAASPLLTDGSNVGINVNGTVQSRSVLPENIGRPFADPMPLNLPLAGEAYICLQHSQLDTDATAVTQTLNMTCMLWQ